MVGPITTDERETQLFRIKVGVALLVGLSMGLVAVQGKASPALVGVAVVAGTVIGGALAWYVFPTADAYKGDDDSPSYRR